MTPRRGREHARAFRGSFMDDCRHLTVKHCFREMAMAAPRNSQPGLKIAFRRLLGCFSWFTALVSGKNNSKNECNGNCWKTGVISYCNG